MLGVGTINEVVQVNPDAFFTSLKLCIAVMWFVLQSQSPAGLVNAPVPAGCDGTWALLDADTDRQLVLSPLLLCLLHLHRYSAFPHLPSVLHEKTVDQYNAWKGLDGRLNLPLLPGAPGLCNSSGDLGGIWSRFQRLVHLQMFPGHSLLARGWIPPQTPFNI